MTRQGVALLVALAGCDAVFGVDRIASLPDGPPPDAYVPGDWRAVTVGDGHQCGIKLDGTLWCWGKNDHGQLGFDATVASASAPQQVGAAKWTSIRTRQWTTCGIQEGSSLWCWGGDSTGQVGDGATQDRFTPYQVTGTWTDVAPGGMHTCALDSAGAPWCWGDNTYGELGQGPSDFTPHPGHVAVSGGVAATVIVAGNQHTCVLAAADQTAWCWGNGYYGELGTGSINTSVSVPTQVSAQPWTNISAGQDHTCARKPDGHLRCWGENFYGQLGVQQPGSYAATPIKVGDDETWSSVAAGTRHTCATREDGTAACWGANDSGQLGTPPSGTNYNPTTIVGGARHWAALAAGTTSTCGISDDSHLWCMGKGVTADATSLIRTPTQVTGSWQAIRAGASNSCAIDEDGALYCWGSNYSGQVGDESYVNRASPSRVGDPSWIDAAMGGTQTCAIRDDGSLYCWGYSYYGLGDNTSSRASPAIIAPGLKFQRVIVGAGWGCAIQQVSSALFCWGANFSYQLGNGNTTVQPTPIMITSQAWTSVTAGASHTCGVGTNGGQCWGGSGNGALGAGSTTTTLMTPTPVVTATQIASQANHTCSLDSGGMARCWGYNASGELGDGTMTTKYTPVQVASSELFSELAVGSSHTCGVTTNGALLCWGDNLSGQLGSDTPTTSMLPLQVGTEMTWQHVACGATHTCATRTDKSLWCWGTNIYGELGVNAAPSYGVVLVP